MRRNTHTKWNASSVFSYRYVDITEVIWYECWTLRGYEQSVIRMRCVYDRGNMYVNLHWLFAHPHSKFCGVPLLSTAPPPSPDFYIPYLMIALPSTWEHSMRGRRAWYKFAFETFLLLVRILPRMTEHSQLNENKLKVRQGHMASIVARNIVQFWNRAQ